MKEVYVFEYLDCVYEGSFRIMSIHKTKKGAYKAMRRYLEKEYKKWREYSLTVWKAEYKFGQDESWRIKTYKILE